MSRIEYEIDKLAPRADAGYSGNPLDPAGVTINKALGRYGAIPPFFIPRKGDIITQAEYDADKIKTDYAASGTVRSVMPMRVKRSGDTEFFTLPIEPLVTISGKNTIVRRAVAKAKDGGTIKECWSQDDYEVTIQGVVTGGEPDEYPEAHVKRLLELFDERQAIEVDQDVLLTFGIKYLAIESVSFPHTNGINNQSYEIKAYSDNNAELLIKI
ncbi:MAG: DUF6046 domain-containing protein [Rikenellaceae bacterium]|nr:DUF6046 domain-containing protein [Rikenellaceae bacterium]